MKLDSIATLLDNDSHPETLFVIGELIRKKQVDDGGKISRPNFGTASERDPPRFSFKTVY